MEGSDYDTDGGDESDLDMEADEYGVEMDVDEVNADYEEGANEFGYEDNDMGDTHSERAADEHGAHSLDATAHQGNQEEHTSGQEASDPDHTDRPNDQVGTAGIRMPYTDIDGAIKFFDEVLTVGRHWAKGRLTKCRAIQGPPTSKYKINDLLVAFTTGGNVGVLKKIKTIAEADAEEQDIPVNLDSLMGDWALLYRFAEVSAPPLSVPDCAEFRLELQEVFDQPSLLAITPGRMYLCGMALKHAQLSIRFDDIPGFLLQLHESIDWSEGNAASHDGEDRGEMFIGDQCLPCHARQALEIVCANRNAEEEREKHDARMKLAMRFDRQRKHIGAGFKLDATTFSRFSVLGQLEIATFYEIYVKKVVPGQEACDRFHAHAFRVVEKMTRELAVEFALKHVGYEEAYREHFCDVLEGLDKPYAVPEGEVVRSQGSCVFELMGVVDEADAMSDASYTM